MENVTTLHDNTTKEYRLYKIEVIVEEDDIQETLEGLRHYGVTPAIYYQVT